jgi:bifunctional DNA-binding transcriptional regulator/antitoxin component of YhaV-PrlF toxin-antitoxin module
MVWVPAEVKKLLDIQKGDKLTWVQHTTSTGSELIVRNNRKNADQSKLSKVPQILFNETGRK